MKDQFKKAASAVQKHVATNRDIYRGAVGGIFIGAGIMALVRKPVVIHAVVLAKVEVRD
jgi:hypothetical protein